MSEWRDRAACAGMPREVFFLPAHPGRAALRAKAVCEGCPVRVKCLTDQLEWELVWLRGADPAGVFGGVGPRERLPMLAQMRAERDGVAA